MDIKEVYKKLCYYDRQNPDHDYAVDDDDSKKARDNCFCDNCFNGRDELALEIIKLRKEAGYII